MIVVGDLLAALVLTLAALACAVAVFGICFFAARVLSSRLSQRRLATRIRAAVWIGFPIAVVGITAGFMTGSSRVSAVGAIVPAMLTFIGLFAVFMVGRGLVPGLVAGFVSLVLAVSLFLGTAIGAFSRDRHDTDLHSVAAAERAADDEFLVRLYRKGLGLPETAPSAPSSETQ